MKNSIEEDIKIVDNFVTYFNRNIQNGYKADLTVLGEEIEAIEHILSDYKRVLKENEELLQEKINNQKIIALAQNDMLDYQAGFEDGKNRRTSAVQSIIENQQYYIFQKQIEKYERHIEKLQKENEGLNNRCRNLDTEAQAYLEELAGDNTLTRRTIKQLNLELEKKEKQIDLMAEQLAGLAIFDIDKDESLILRDKEEIKQYFKEKVEG